MEDGLNTEHDQVQDDQLAALPAERLAQMLRDKRKAEATVRGKLRETETERDTLAGTVSSFQQGKLHELAKAGGVLDSALVDVDSHLKIAELLGDDGTLDGEKVTTALAALKTDRPHYFPQAPQLPRSSGSFEHTGAAPRSEQASWNEVLNG